MKLRSRVAHMSISSHVYPQHINSWRNYFYCCFDIIGIMVTGMGSIHHAPLVLSPYLARVLVPQLGLRLGIKTLSRLILSFLTFVQLWVYV